eukprot:TRINITY_DN17129_c0_g1_i5.p1 TRINITY_DN17129_c0_g1~~TRINITY_DN17129_c0_g1_i5.p1  ORF type:complete len:112 (+),score=8.32 TRINITY_DN17129_c0_g1_i5:338-673(+)
MPLYAQKHVLDAGARDILIRIDANTPKGSYYFNFKAPHLRDFWRKMIKDLGFDTLPTTKGLTFDGPHCLRHGGMAYLTSLGATQEQLLVTKKTLGHYIRPNEKRSRDGTYL